MATTHWEGPHLGSDRARGGVFQDLPIDLTSRYVKYFSEAWMDGAAARIGAAGTHWTTVVHTGGTFVATTGTLVLVSPALNQGPAAYMGGTVFTTPPTYANINTGDLCAMEARVQRTNAAGVTSVFVGYATTPVAGHPLTTAGAINNGVVADGVGWLWNGTTNGVPVLWDNGTVRTVTSSAVIAGGQNTTFDAGVRIELRGGNENIQWYGNGRFLHRQNVSGQFSTAMAPVIATVTISGTGHTVNVFGVNAGRAQSFQYT